jgi:N-hydroxyarylamine O-acetyltransferase
MAPLTSFDAYLARIGLAGRVDVSLTELHRAHAGTIPFENFDSYSGRPVSLEPADLEDKMVARGRGGYCFEHNLLFTGACQSLGVEQVDQLLARVRIAPEESGGRPLNHLLLRVTDSQGTWLADVGFGGGGLVDPVPFELGVETEQSGWRYRLTEDGPEWVLQVFQDGGWSDMYGFVPEPAPHVDIVVNNWYTSTHPASMFVNAVMTGIRRPDRCLTMFVFENAMVIERPVGGASSMTEVPLHDVPALLAERFALDGVSVDGGRLTLREHAGRPAPDSR